MSDLISRNDLIYKIRGIVPGSQDVDFIIGLIENQPTAFDTERVVEQLEVLHDLVNDNQKLAVSQSIDIVKKGGVEWKFVVIDAKNLLSRIV